jgi:hypothetical protein
VPEKNKLICAVERACDWIAKIAQHKEDSFPPCQRAKTMLHKTWKGAIKGEYKAATKQWDVFCPAWHTGQAVAALCDGYSLTHNDLYLDAAKLGANFILRESVKDQDDPDYGLLYAIEDYDDSVNTSAILESLKGLWRLHRLTGETMYKEALTTACDWVARKAYMGEGHFRDNYSLLAHRFETPAYMDYFVPPQGMQKHTGRPLADDATFLKAYIFTGNEAYKQIFYSTVDYLCTNEYPSGTWSQYHPCGGISGIIHPRQGYWWGLPMYDAFIDSGDEKYLDCLKRCAHWYVNAQRLDGGFFRGTSVDFKTDSFGHATSGALCAAILWEHLYKIDKNPLWHEASERSLDYSMNLQFINPEDPNLKGAILEKVVMPDGTDSSPFYIRDLGTVFFVQAAACYLSNEYACDGMPDCSNS